MNIAHTSETWLFYGMCDLFFALHTEEWVFDYHSAFSGIMALEKHLKATIILSRGNEFSSLEEGRAKAKVQAIAKEYSHNFEKMISSCNEYFGDDQFSNLINQNYDGYNGNELCKVLRDSYMETRYPTTTQVSQEFPIDENEGIYHNPLGSSGLHKLIFSVCEFVIVNLSSAIDEDKLLRNVTQQYSHLESFSRFKNLYLAGRWS